MRQETPPSRLSAMTYLPCLQRPGWLVGAEADTRDPPPESTHAGLRALYGCAPGDWKPRLYLVPENTAHGDLIDFFEVGSASAVRHGWDQRETLDLIASTLNSVTEIIPGSIELATSGRLRFRFWRHMRLDELEEIERVYASGRIDDYQAGLELYLHNGLSGSSLLHDVRESGLLHLQWS